MAALTAGAGCPAVPCVDSVRLGGQVRSCGDPSLVKTLLSSVPSAGATIDWLVFDVGSGQASSPEGRRTTKQ